MEKIKDISKIKLINSQCLIEITDMFNKVTKSGIIVGDVNYNKNVHAVRYGLLTKMPSSINWDKASWRTDSFPLEGDEVWFDYLDAHETPLVTNGGKIYMILPYFSLLVARSPKKGITPLNGYLLAQKAPIPMTKLDVTQRYYDDIYNIVYAGKHNLSYKDERYVDDPSITEGSVVMTRSSAYPVLEESLHARFSKETFYYFQRKDCVGMVEL